LKDLFTYAFYLGPRSAIGGLFLKQALFAEGELNDR
jgi:hypothetical protein